MQEALGSVPVPNKIRCNSLCVNPGKMEKIQGSGHESHLVFSYIMSLKSGIPETLSQPE